MEKKRKRIQITDTQKIAARVASSAKRQNNKKIDREEQEEEQDVKYPNKPNLQFQ